MLKYNEKTGEFEDVNIEETPSNPNGGELINPNDYNLSIVLGALGGILLGMVILLFYYKIDMSNPLEQTNIVNSRLDGKFITLNGTVGKDIGFTMHLQIKGNEVEGTEHYDKNKTNANLEIKGSINGDEMVLYEYERNVECGVFNGKIAPFLYSGVFTNKRGRKYSFIATIND